MCYIGHGVFGIITKEVWCNYFAVFGIGRDMAYSLMPVVGGVDILLGVIMLIYPMRSVAGWLVFWGLFTASLRPLSGEPFAELIERAGNFGAPFVLLLISGPYRFSRKYWFEKLSPANYPPIDVKRVTTCLQVVAFLLLLGHGWLNVIEKKGLLAQYASIGISNPSTVASIIGWAEITAAFIILLKPVKEIVFVVFLWKMASETLYLSYPVYEWVERGGSYAVLLCLWLIQKQSSLKLSTMRTKPVIGIGLLISFFSVLSCNEGTNESGMVVGASMLSLQSEFVVNVKDAMVEEAKNQKIKLIVNDAQRTADRQVQQIESFISQKVNAIILNPCEVEASSPAVEKAKAAGIVIINVNSETAATPDGFVGSRDEESAEIAMEHIAKLIGGKGNIVILDGYMGQAAQLKRSAGAKSILEKYPEIKVLAEQTAEWDRAKAMSLMENWIQSYGDKINAVFAHNDEMGMGALQALEQAKLKEKVVVVSIDAIADALQAVKAGRLDATVFQDAHGQGAGAVDMAVKLAKLEPVEIKNIFIPFQLVTKENADKFIK